MTEKLQCITVYITMEIAPSHCHIDIETTTRRGYFHSNIDTRVKPYSKGKRSLSRSPLELVFLKALALSITMEIGPCQWSTNMGNC